MQILISLSVPLLSYYQKLINHSFVQNLTGIIQLSSEWESKLVFLKACTAAN